MLEDASNKRQVPLWVPVSVCAIIGTFLAGAFLLRSMPLQLVFGFPLGLSLFFVGSSLPKDESSRTDALLLLIILPYCLYIVLFIAMFAARKWNTFWKICLVLTCALLLNVAGCRHGLSHFQ